MSRQHSTTLNDTPFSPAYDRASFDEFIAAATARIDMLRCSIDSTRERLARLQGDRAAHVGAQADLGLRVMRAQMQLEQERRDTEATVREVLAAADDASTRLLAEARSEARLLRAAIAEISVAPEDGMGQVLRFRSHLDGDAVRSDEHTDEKSTVAQGWSQDGPAGSVAAIS